MTSKYSVVTPYKTGILQNNKFYKYNVKHEKNTTPKIYYYVYYFSFF